MTNLQLDKTPVAGGTHLVDQSVSVSAGDFTVNLHIDSDGRLRQHAFGGVVTEGEATPLAYPAAGDGWVFDPAISIVHADGNTSTDLRVTAVSQEDGLTTITLQDPEYSVIVDLSFRALPEYQVIETWTSIRNEESGAIQLENYASSAVALSPDSYFLTQFHGDWADEANMVEERLTPGLKVLDSKLGVRAHQFRAPWFLLSRGHAAAEESGEVFAGSLAWSGSFRFSFEGLPKGAYQVVAGVNPYAATLTLEPGESQVTPKMIWARSATGTRALSQALHRYVRAEALRDGDRLRDILLNNWEATYFTFDEGKIISLFDGAKDLGMELFLLDDGWFGEKYPRDGDTQGLGDWMVDPKKLPNGLGVLPKAAIEKGLRFGLWFEPEMVNPLSALFEAHPDWVICQPKRELETQRNQMALDLTNPEVEAFVYSVLDDALRANPGITYVKWDCNRYLTQPGSFYLGAKDQGRLWTGYVEALYRVMDRLATEHPNVEIMMCSGGGGRVDYGALRFAHEVWPSDMTDPLRRIFIQWGFSYFIPAIATAAHVTRWGERPLKFCFDVAMSGRLGMDIDVDKLSPEDRQLSKDAIAQYKRIRSVVQLGEMSRLESPYEYVRSAVQFSEGDRSVAFVFSRGEVASMPLALCGLVSDAKYRVVELAPGDPDRLVGVFSGADLMGPGLPIPAMQECTSHVFELTLA